MIRFDTTMSNLLTPTEVAERLRVSEITLKRWRIDGTGPKAVHLSARTIRYPEDQLNEWLQSQRKEPHNGTEG